ncbi:hypothetical protein [Crateriforma conspicua]|nr:hypothetical protein [Crateriforma conspicua]
MPQPIKPSVTSRRGIIVRLELWEREKLHRESILGGYKSLQQYCRVRLGLGPDVPKSQRPSERESVDDYDRLVADD